MSPVGRAPESESREVGRFAAVDVHYPADGGATAALVLAADARFATVVAERAVRLRRVAPYRPGAFFVRELPALRAAA